MRFLCLLTLGLLLTSIASAQSSSNPLCQNPTKLQGNENYWYEAQNTVTGNCTALANPSVTITITSDMSGDSKGFDFQFNVGAQASPKYPHGANASGGRGLVGWQQYIINVYSSKDASNRTDIFGMVNNWPTKPPPGPCYKHYSNNKNCDQGSNIINTRGTNQIFHLLTLEDTPIPTLPSGTTLTIQLNTDPNNNLDVTGVTYTVTVPKSVKTVKDPTYTYYNGKTIPLTSILLAPSICKGNPPDSRYCPSGFVYNKQNPVSPGNVTLADTSPVTAITLDIANDNSTQKGGGTISYSASNTDLVALKNYTGLPNVPVSQVCVAAVWTGETSSYTYSTVDPCTAGSTTQNFQLPYYCGTMPKNNSGAKKLECANNSPFCVAGDISYHNIGDICAAGTVPKLSSKGTQCSTPSLPSCNVGCTASYTCTPNTECIPSSPKCNVPTPVQ